MRWWAVEFSKSQVKRCISRFDPPKHMSIRVSFQKGVCVCARACVNVVQYRRGKSGWIPVQGDFLSSQKACLLPCLSCLPSSRERSPSSMEPGRQGAVQCVCRGEWVGVFVKAIKDAKLEAFSDSVDIAIARPASALLQPLPRTPSAETCCSMMWWCQQLNLGMHLRNQTRTVHSQFNLNIQLSTHSAVPIPRGTARTGWEARGAAQ
jgi:hypothetical protein